MHNVSSSILKKKYPLDKRKKETNLIIQYQLLHCSLSIGKIDGSAALHNKSFD